MCLPNNNSVWLLINNEECGFNIGGICNITTNNCDCLNGFQNDMLLYRQRDCLMNMIYIYIIFSTIATLSFGAFILSLYKLKNSISTARYILIFISFGSFNSLIFCIGVIVNGFIVNGFLLGLITLVVAIVYSLGYITIYSLASPLFKMAERSERLFVIFLKLGCTMFRLIQLILYIIMITLYEDPSDPNNDIGWNNFQAIALEFVGIELLFLFVTVTYFSKKLILFVEILIENTPSNPNHPTTRLYLAKIQQLIKNFMRILPFSIGLLIATPIIYILTGYLPFFYIIISLSWTNIVFIFFVLIIYASRENASSQQAYRVNVVIKVEDNIETQINESKNGCKVENTGYKSEFLSSRYEESKITHSETDI